MPSPATRSTPSITGAEQQSVAHRDSSRVRTSPSRMRASRATSPADKREKIAGDGDLGRLTGVDDKLKLAILEATEEQQGKMIASLKERRAPFQWDEGGVDPLRWRRSRRDRASRTSSSSAEHVALVERTQRSACAGKRRGRQPLPYDEWTEFGMPSEGRRRSAASAATVVARHKDANDAARAQVWRARGARLRLAARAPPPLTPTSPRNVGAARRRPAAALAAVGRLRRRAARPRRLAPPPDVGASVDERHGRGGDEASGGAPLSAPTRCARSTRRHPAGSSQSSAPSHPKSTRTTAAAASRRAGAEAGTARRREWAAGPERVQGIYSTAFVATNLYLACRADPDVLRAATAPPLAHRVGGADRRRRHR